MTYGWFQVRRGMDNRAAEKEEKRRARLALVPTLVAERDARMAAYQAEWNELEAKVGGTAVHVRAVGTALCLFQSTHTFSF